MTNPNVGDMLVYKVWHRTQPTFMDDKTSQISADLFPKGFHLVAEVRTDQGPFHCFELTNTIDHPWWQNPECMPINGFARSTSVGDVIECPDGAAFMVLGMGWEQIRSARP